MSLSEKDRQTIWHPYTQMQTAPAAIPIVRGEGARLYQEDGSVLLDTISSWWVTVHGHGHPYIADAIGKQARELEQVIFAGFTHPPAVTLAERLLAKLPQRISRVFFSDNGSTAVEVALKMAWQYWQNKGRPKQRLIALRHAYHGDTFGAMSVSGRSIFTRAFEELLFDVNFVSSPGEVPVETVLQELEVAAARDDVAAIIVEPLVQGAGGMLMYSAEALDQIISFCREKEILVIFDEVMTGFYRTGKIFASNHCLYKPDIVCLSKGLTGGYLPMSITACSEEIYAAFLSDDRSQMLFHGHSFTANPLGCAAANASLDLFERSSTQDRISQICKAQEEGRQLLSNSPYFTNVRCTGTVLAMDLADSGASNYLNDIGKRFSKWFEKKGVLIRPLGNVVYTMPPYSMEVQALKQIYLQMEEAVEEIRKEKG